MKLGKMDLDKEQVMKIADVSYKVGAGLFFAVPTLTFLGCTGIASLTDAEDWNAMVNDSFEWLYKSTPGITMNVIFGACVLGCAAKEAYEAITKKWSFNTNFFSRKSKAVSKGSASGPTTS